MNEEELPITQLEKFLKKYQEMNGGDFPSPEIVYAQIEMMREEHDQQSKGMYTEEEVKKMVTDGFIAGVRQTNDYLANERMHPPSSLEYWESIKPKK